MASAINNFYDIIQKYRPKYPKKTGDSIIVEDFGSFETTIDMEVIKKSLIIPYSQDNDGILVQLITKTTNFASLKGPNPDIFDDINYELCNTEQKVLDYTSNNVKYSNCQYLEYFETNIHGYALDGDIFGSGAIAKYNGMSVNLNDGSTFGIIIQIGESVFIHKDNPYYTTCTGLGWKKNTNHSSHGLDYIEDTVGKKVIDLWDEIFSHSDSGERKINLVTVAWQKKPLGRNTTNPTKVKLVQTINKNVLNILLPKNAINIKELQENVLKMMTNEPIQKDSINTKINVNRGGENKKIRTVKNRRIKTVKNRRINRRKTVKRSRKMH